MSTFYVRLVGQDPAEPGIILDVPEHSNTIEQVLKWSKQTRGIGGQPWVQGETEDGVRVAINLRYVDLIIQEQ